MFYFVFFLVHDVDGVSLPCFAMVLMLDPFLIQTESGQRSIL